MYGKHFAAMYTGSMLGAGTDVFAVWGYVISHTIASVVELNPKLLAYILGAKESEIIKAIEYLCAPDPNSRSQEEDGRRLVKTGTFSYLVVNHEVYRGIRSEEERREYNRVKQAEHRARKKDDTYEEGEAPGATKEKVRKRGK
jgi:hypothetical protein